MKKTIDFNSLTRRHMAEICGKTERTITNWVKDGCPRGSNGKFSAPEVINWLLLRESDMASDGNDSPALERYREARAKLVEMELKERGDELLDASQVEKEAFDLARQVRDSILGIPNRIADQIVVLDDRVEIIKVLTDELTNALEKLSQ